MSLTQVLTTDNFAIWREKTNLVFSNVGDLALLNAEILAAISPDTDLVSAINHISENVTRQVLIKSIAMS